VELEPELHELLQDGAEQELLHEIEEQLELLLEDEQLHELLLIL
jgi:cell wall assembly regulator SMI1